MPDERFRALLKKRWEVLIEENPEIGFKWDLVEKVCEMWGVPLRRENLNESPTIHEFLATLKTDWSKREFMAHYITEWEINEMKPKTEQLAASA